jgi:hypothetical protein
MTPIYLNDLEEFVEFFVETSRPAGAGSLYL